MKQEQTLQQVTILGATGTIGVQTLDVIARHPDRYRVFALTANTKVDILFEQCITFKPKFAVLLDKAAAEQLKDKLAAVDSETVVLLGVTALETVSAHDETDIVMAAIVGAAGLLPAIAAAKAGKKVLLANKETLVMAGRLFTSAVKEGGASLLPIDSEHNAIFQVMPQNTTGDLDVNGIKRILLTASGGPFRTFDQSALENVTKSQALKHPNWEMGPKITIDSATLMNKGLEVIEAHWLFNASADQIDVVVHPQSIIHSMVEYIDGSVLAQLGNPDMRTPIAYGLGYPDRIQSGVSSLDFFKMGQLDFEKPDTDRFPCLRLAFDALKAGGTAPAILNASNEVAVAAFLNEQISFMAIPHVIESTLSASSIEEVSDIEQLLAVDKLARLQTEQAIETLGNI